MSLLSLRLALASLCWLAVPALGYAQTQLQQGTYQSEDGRVEMLVTPETDGSLTIILPNRTNHYLRQSGNEYKHSEQPDYLLRVNSSAQFTTYLTGNQNSYSFNLKSAGRAVPQAVAEHPQWQGLYEKYKAKAARKEGGEVQAWAFCAAVAHTRANLADNQEVTDSFIEPIIVSLKQILANPDVCPCSDVISAAQWAQFNP